MWVTSAAKVVVPGILNLLEVRRHNGLRLANLHSGKARMVGQNHLRCQPELGLTVSMCNMNMDTRLLTRKEKEVKRTVTNNGGCHAGTLTNFQTSKLMINTLVMAKELYPG